MEASMTHLADHENVTTAVKKSIVSFTCIAELSVSDAAITIWRCLSRLSVYAQYKHLHLDCR